MSYYDTDETELSDSVQSFDAEIQSPSGMQIDGDEYVIEPPESGLDDVAIINPDEDVDQVPGLPRADNCKSHAHIHVNGQIQDADRDANMQPQTRL
jgi:hypothetical protein